MGNPALQRLIRTNTVEIAELGALVFRTKYPMSASYLNTLDISYRVLRRLLCISE